MLKSLLQMGAALFILSVPAPALSSQAYPRLYLEYGFAFDLNCAKDSKRPITEEMQEEVDRRLPEFQALWDREGAPLVKATADLLGKSFGRKEETVTPFLCSSFPPMSHPLSVRIREYLQSSTTPDRADFMTTLKPDYYFVSQLHHELLHRYLTSNFKEVIGLGALGHSALLKKYRNESSGVLAHLHLLALQQAVYLRLGHRAEIEKVIRMDSQIPGGIYKRSWEIVNQEGFEGFLKELK